MELYKKERIKNMAKETTIARESKANPINGVRSGRNLDWFDMISPDDTSRKREIRQRMAEIREEMRPREEMARRAGGASPNYPEEYWKLQRELWKLNGIPGVR